MAMASPSPQESGLDGFNLDGLTPPPEILEEETTDDPKKSKYSKVSFDKILLNLFQDFIGSSMELTSDIRKLARFYVMWAKKEAPHLYKRWQAIDTKYGRLDGKSRKFKPGELQERLDFITDYSNLFDMMGYLPNKGQHEVERPFILQDVIDDWDSHVYIPGGMVIIRGGKGSGKSNFQAQEAIRLAQAGYLVITSNQLNMKNIGRDFSEVVVRNIKYVNTIAQLLEARAKDMLRAETRDEMRTMVVFHDDMDMALGTLKATGVDMRNFSDFNILLRKLGICYVGTYHLLKVPEHVKTEVRVWINKGYYYDQWGQKHEFGNPKQSYSIMVEDLNYPDVYGVPDYGPYFFTGATGDLSFSGTPIMDLSIRLSRLTTDSPRVMGEAILKFLNVRIKPWENDDAPEPYEFMDALDSYTCETCGALWEDFEASECPECRSAKLSNERIEKPRLPKEDFVATYAGYKYGVLTQELRNAGRSEGRPFTEEEYWYFKDKGFPDTLLAALFIKGRSSFPTKNGENGENSYSTDDKTVKTEDDDENLS